MTQRSVPGYWGPSLVVRGRVFGRGDITVAGRHEGELDVDGELLIAGDGKVVGHARATKVIVAGELVGDATGTEVVAIRAGGRIEGNVRAPQVAIDDGGALHGGVDMDFAMPDEMGGV